MKLTDLTAQLASFTDPANVIVPSSFWAWRKEYPARQQVLNRAGMSLTKTEAGWVADISTVTDETLAEAGSYVAGQKDRDREFRAMENRTLRAGDRARRRQFGRY